MNEGISEPMARETPLDKVEEIAEEYIQKALGNEGTMKGDVNANGVADGKELAAVIEWVNKQIEAEMDVAKREELKALKKRLARTRFVHEIVRVLVYGIGGVIAAWLGLTFI